MTGATDRFLQLARDAGMPKGQVINFLRAGAVPQSKQIEFHVLCRSCDEPNGPTEVAMGGARGPGKSWALLAQLGLDDCQRRDGLKCLLLRKVGKAVRESLEDLRQTVLKHCPHKYNRSAGTLTFNNGSRIILGHFKDERDIDNYLGLEYDVIGVEEATTLPSSRIKMIRTCQRTSRGDWRPRTYYNANPGGIGHGWFKRKFVGGPHFIPCTYRDNAFLDSGYEANLNDLTGWLKRAWKDGDWDIQAGLYYSNWRPGIHIMAPPNLTTGEYTFYLAIDYGWQHPTVALLLAERANRDIIIAGEYRGPKRLPEAHSREMMAMLGGVGVSRDWLRATVIGSDAFRTESDGECVADDYKRLGWRLEPATMGRVRGAVEILRRLGEPPEIRPSLYISSACPGLIAQLPMMMHDPKRPEDVLKVNADEDGFGGDDFYDTLRYGLQIMATEKTLIEGPGLFYHRR